MEVDGRYNARRGVVGNECARVWYVIWQRRSGNHYLFCQFVHAASLPQKYAILRLDHRESVEIELVWVSFGAENTVSTFGDSESLKSRGNQLTLG